MQWRIIRFFLCIEFARLERQKKMDLRKTILQGYRSDDIGKNYMRRLWQFFLKKPIELNIINKLFD